MCSLFSLGARRDDGKKEAGPYCTGGTKSAGRWPQEGYDLSDCPENRFLKELMQTSCHSIKTLQQDWIWTYSRYHCLGWPARLT